MMKKRREFLLRCSAMAGVFLLPAAGLFSRSRGLGYRPAYGLDEFQSLLGKRTPLREGGWVVVTNIDPLGRELRCQQFTVRMLPESARESGIYTLETEMGARPLYLEAGGSTQAPSLTACVGHMHV